MASTLPQPELSETEILGCQVAGLRAQVLQLNLVIAGLLERDAKRQQAEPSQPPEFTARQRASMAWRMPLGAA